MRFFSLLLLVGPLAGCGSKLFTVHVRESSVITVEQGTMLEGLLTDFGYSDFSSMDLTASEELQNQGAEPGDVVDVRLEEFVLEALSGDPDLSFVTSMSLYVSAPDLPEQRIAYQDDFPEGQAEVAFILEGIDLTDYVVSQSMTLSSEAEGTRPSQDTQVEARFDLAIGITGQGVGNNL